MAVTKFKPTQTPRIMDEWAIEKNSNVKKTIEDSKEAVHRSKELVKQSKEIIATGRSRRRTA
jgi:hypothetical protein